MNVFPINVTDQDVARYWERGYWISPKLMDEPTIAVLRREVQRIFNDERDSDNYVWYEFPKPKPGTQQLHQVTNAWWINRTLRQLVTHPHIGRMAGRLMQTDAVRLWHDQVLSKPGVGHPAGANDEGNVGWHQDYAHWQCANTTNLCSIWLALQDTDLSNGGMRTIIGSHKWGLVENASTFYEKNLEGLREKYGRGKEWIDEPCVLQAGQASFHHALTFHGSGPNRTHDPRLCVIMHVMPADCGLRTDGRWHLCATLLGPEAKAGQLFAGSFFPTLWSADRAERSNTPTRAPAIAG